MKTNGYDRSESHSRPQPHFDDERTVLSARPVVPLEKIKHRKHWLLGGAFAIAMLLGAGSALLASYLRFKSSVPDTANEISQEEIIPAPLVIAESVPSESPVVESVEQPSDISIEPKKESTLKRRTIVRHTPELDRPRNEPDESKVDEQDALQRIREAVLYDEWQERRARRVRRERRKLDRYNHRDLSNLDEIFEGRRKP